MSETYDLILKGGTVVNQDGEGLRDVAIRDGRIAGIGSFDAAQAGERIDCSGLHVLPGVMDTQVHFREPGLDHKEDLETGSRARRSWACVTTVFEMPNTNPLTTDEAALADKVSRGHHRMHCDFAFWVGGTRGKREGHSRAGTPPGSCRHQGFHGLLDRQPSCRRR